jgi:hypothetical protein
VRDTSQVRAAALPSVIRRGGVLAVAILLGACNSLIGIEEGKLARNDGEGTESAASGASTAASGAGSGASARGGASRAGGCACDLPHARATCESPGSCRIAECERGLADCNGDPSDGCEASLSDPLHCGSCAVACPASAPVCSSGACTAACQGGFHVCDGVCFDDDSTAACGATCTPCPALPNAEPECERGECSFDCLPGFGNCDRVAANGCETALDTRLNCGACGRACLPGQLCTNSVCL